MIKYRVRVEIEYFIALCESDLPQLTGVDHKHFDALRAIYKNFSTEDAQKIKDIEKVTNHDVKAVEYFLKQTFDDLNLGKYKEFIHFGLTSQDINNTAIPLSVKEAYEREYLPKLKEVIIALKALMTSCEGVAMLARTHGQPASLRVWTKNLTYLKHVLINNFH